ncbi:DNA adenine methylase [Cytobacillus gottheilii]|uniref:DNA adenine methylase n=1 Tax=Cytobacillus gottheilii TaxID=859144 RepID=UPI002494678B|nr:DNA adenine methylase [Cytobacillus gottheilii]
MLLTCQFCGITDNCRSDDFQMDSQNQGFWCEVCDGYTYIDNNAKKHRFTLILEDREEHNAFKPSLDIKLSKQLSPYRYPGGKSKLIDYLYTQLQQENNKKLVSPFTGGGSFELAMLESGVVESIHLNDRDLGVFGLWWTIKHMPYELIDRIKTHTPSHKDYFSAQSVIKSNYKGVNLIEAAWTSLLVNRLAYSGIYKANPLGGRYGDDQKLLSRWNPKNLIARIEKIHSISGSIEVTNLDALELIEEAYWEPNTTLFIDPPYVHKGKDLYFHHYKNEDHISLPVLLDSLYHGCPGADIIVTYDHTKWLSETYCYPIQQVISRKYSA